MTEVLSDKHFSPVQRAGEMYSVIDELRMLRDRIPPDPGVCIAILDGPVDFSHQCFRGAQLRRVETLVGEDAGSGRMSTHGTHVASVVFGQPLSGTLGLASGCRGLVVPVFRDSHGHLSQLDLARAIERAVTEGADVINISGGERVPRGLADPLLARAIDLCEQSGVLVVAAAGNDGCDCVHVPAALPTVLAVGALDVDGRPAQSNNFGSEYSINGVLAPGAAIPGASPGGVIAPMSGSSFAAPIVSSLAALLLCEQRRLTGAVDVTAVRRAILSSALPCLGDADELARCLGGILNVRGAHALITQGGEVTQSDATYATHAAAQGGATAHSHAGVVASAAPAASGELPPMDSGPPPDAGSGQYVAAPIAVAATPGPAPAPAPMATGVTPADAVMPGPVREWFAGLAQMPPPVARAAPPPAVSPSSAGQSIGHVTASACSCGTKPSVDAPAGPGPRPSALTPVFAIGNIGFDFGTEARRDTFRMLMPNVNRAATDNRPASQEPPNPYDTKQLADYLDDEDNQGGGRSESTKLIWTLMLDLTHIYAIEPEPAYADAVYAKLRAALRNQALPADEDAFISRVSLPGVLTTRTVTLYSGQVVPVVVTSPRGMFLWQEAKLVQAAVDAVDPASLGADPERVALKVRQMLDKVYYQMRNLGTAGPDRAINFMATNAFQFTQSIAEGLVAGKIVDGDTTHLYSLDTISAVKSPYCRPGSECYEVQLSFFDPDNDQRARVVLQNTVDVSDVTIPVLLAPTHQFLSTG